MPYSLRTIHELVQGELLGNAEQLIHGVGTLESAKLGELTFAEHDRYAPQVRLTRATAVIVSTRFPPIHGMTLLRVANPRAAFVQVMRLFQTRQSSASGIHPAAIVSPQAVLEPDVAVGACAVVGSSAQIGHGTIVESGAYVGPEVMIGKDCYIGPNVVLMEKTRLGNRVMIHGGSVIGGDGFGYVWDGARHMKIPQLGNVVIEDDVEIGCNVCVDRATLGSTIIRQGTKIDNLVQVAHNDVIGRHVIVTGQGGFSGSVTVGDHVVFGGRAGVTDHVTIGEGARIGICSVVTKSVPAGEVVFGYPVRPAKEVKRRLAALTQLPRLLKELRELRTRVAEMETQLRMPGEAAR